MKKINLLILMSLFISTTFSQSYTLSTFAGGGFGDESDANLAKLNNPVYIKEMKYLILLLIPLFSMAQPDITKAYLTGSKPKKAIRSFDNGTFVEFS